ERVRGLGAEPSESPGEREPAVAAGAVEDALDARVHAAQRDLAPARVEEPPPVRAEPAPVQRARRRDREREQHDESEHGAHHPWPRSCISATVAPRASAGGWSERWTRWPTLRRAPPSGSRRGSTWTGSSTRTGASCCWSPCSWGSASSGDSWTAGPGYA